MKDADASFNVLFLCTGNSARSVIAVLYLALFGSIVAFTAFNWLLRHVRPTLATSYAYVNPIVAIALVVLLLSAFGGSAAPAPTTPAPGSE